MLIRRVYEREPKELIEGLVGRRLVEVWLKKKWIKKEGGTGKGSERGEGVTAHGQVFGARDRCTGKALERRSIARAKLRAERAVRGREFRRVRTSQGSTRGNGARGRAGTDWCASIAFALDMQAWYLSFGVG